MAKQVTDSIHVVGGVDLSEPGDCLVYFLDLGELVLIDCGVGPGWDRIADNIREIGHDPAKLHTLVLTHCHVDHVGAAARVKKDSGCRIVAHQLDRAAIVTADPQRTAAGWYDIDLAPAPVDHTIKGASDTLHFARGTLELLHVPGHTPGSLVGLHETEDGTRVLFGQDIHGPFNRTFGSDMTDWRESMQRIIDLEPDILCEGHYGVFRGKERVRKFIEDWLEVHGQ